MHRRRASRDSGSLALSETSAKPVPLYVSAPKVYPREATGRFDTARQASVVVLLGLYYGVAWLHLDGRQLLLFDLPARKFHVFGLTLFPQDFLLLTLLLTAAAVSLFLFTAVAGRMWCGYACPQTVWTEVFLWMERRIEGDRRTRMKLDQAPWDARKVGLKGLKHVAWIVFSLWTGFTFVGYFTPIAGLAGSISAGTVSGWEAFWIAFYSFATYGNAGWMREQVCEYMCPYARFQSAMFDGDTLIVSYDEARGEPRGSRRRGAPEAGTKGDCIDCTLCVQVCPVGIDIREGLQYQCIACAACVDVCDSVMDRMGTARGLVCYSTGNALVGRPARIVRPRTIVYSVVLLTVVVTFVVLLATRDLLMVDVIRDRNALYRETGRGFVENVYTLNLINKDTKGHAVALAVSGVDGLILATDQHELYLAPESVESVGVRVRFRPEDVAAPNVPVDFHVRSLRDASLQASSRARLLKPVH